ncbi:hypothetical protein HAX54_045846, partial [Datura stramonium]|nr:hypothetical protein [Datura stramonium]
MVRRDWFGKQQGLVVYGGLVMLWWLDERGEKWREVATVEAVRFINDGRSSSVLEREEGRKRKMVRKRRAFPFGGVRSGFIKEDEPTTDFIGGEEGGRSAAGWFLGSSNGGQRRDGRERGDGWRLDGKERKMIR